MNFEWLQCVGWSLVKKRRKKKKNHSGKYVDSGVGYACLGAKCMWEISVSLSQFCGKPKTTLKT